MLYKVLEHKNSTRIVKVGWIFWLWLWTYQMLENKTCDPCLPYAAFNSHRFIQPPIQLQHLLRLQGNLRSPLLPWLPALVILVYTPLDSGGHHFFMIFWTTSCALKAFNVPKSLRSGKFCVYSILLLHHVIFLRHGWWPFFSTTKIFQGTKKTNSKDVLILKELSTCQTWLLRSKGFG